jgi:GNAT superfamily N-acetyltransferase
MGFAIRRARWPDDAPALAALDRSFESDRVLRVTRGGLGFVLREETVSPPYHRTEAALDVDELLTFPVVFVAERTSDVIGYGALRCDEWNRRGVVAGLYVDREHRGAGVGRALIDAIEDAARRAEMNRLWAETQDVNVPAVRFYIAVGFSLCGLDTTLYDPETPAGEETALYLSRPIA